MVKQDTSHSVNALRVGDRARTRYVTVDSVDIIAFAQQWDPQPFHLDADKAQHSTFGGLVASGLHTLALTYSLSPDTEPGMNRRAAGVGIDALRWLRPLRPGDRVLCETEILFIVAGRTADTGDVTVEMRCIADTGEPVLTCELSMRVSGVAAERPSVVVVTRETEVNPDRLWSLLADFWGIDRWLDGAMPVLDEASDSPVGIGHDRQFTIGDAAFRERLTRFDPATRTMAYRLIEGPLPVRGYGVTLWVHPTGDTGSRAIWQARFLPDGIAADTCERLITRALTKALDGLAQATEGGR